MSCNFPAIKARDGPTTRFTTVKKLVSRHGLFTLNSLCDYFTPKPNGTRTANEKRPRVKITLV
jgi:hypothetical protein